MISERCAIGIASLLWRIPLAAMLLLATLHAGAQQRGNPVESRMRFIDNGIIRLGIDLDLGGAITYLSKSGTEVNMINSFDWGRQIQMSNYSGPIPFEPNGKKPTPTWAGLGWNPIQSGDCHGNRSKVTYFKSSGNAMTVRCIPMQWPLDNEPGECEFECKLALDGPAVHVDCSLVNHRSDHTQFDARDQELPAIYTNGPWYHLMTYEGDSPFTNDKLAEAPAAFPWTGWRATENWSALVDDKGFGVGVLEPGVTRFIGGFAGKPGSGGPKDNPTGYIAPLHVEILDYNITYRYSYTLVVGTISSIRKYVYDHSVRPTPPNYHFDKDRQHWRYINALDSGWPINGELKVSMAHPNPQLMSPEGFWSADSARTLHVTAAFPHGINTLRVFWSGPDAPGFSEERVVNFKVIDDDKYHDYTFDLGKSAEYKGNITNLRLDPETPGIPGAFVRLKRVGYGSR